MKKSRLGLVAALVLGGLLVSNPMARAQDSKAATEPKLATAAKPATAPKSKDPVDKLAAKMQLSAEQKEKLSALYQEQTEKLAKAKQKAKEEKDKLASAFQARVKESKILSDAEYKNWLAIETKGKSAAATPHEGSGAPEPEAAKAR